MDEQNIKQDSWQAWWLAARPKTLTGAAVPVMIGVSLAWVDCQQLAGETFRWIPALLCLLFAFLMQIDANFINDYFDYVRGNDDAESRLGPLRACTQGWVKPSSMKSAITITTLLACVIGLPLVYYGGLEMILVGIICVIFCFLYTTHLSYMALGDLLVLVFFGIVPVGITYYIQLHAITAQVFLASVACGLVIDGLLVVNNYRDRENDLRDGKRTLVVEMGAKAAELLYLTLGITAVAIGVVFLLNGHWAASLLPVVYLIFHIRTWQKMVSINHGRQLNECLGETARNMFIYGCCVAIGLLI